MQKRNLTILLGMIFLSVSCTKKVLDKSPVSSFSASGFYKTTSDAQAGVYGIYNAAQSVFRINFAYWGEARADNVITTQTGDGLSLQQNNLTPSLSSADWTNLYTMISRANYAIKYIPNVYAPNDQQGNQLIGQARALRALAYFYLVRIWGAVPLITEPYTSVTQNIFVERTDTGKVLDQIVSDLQYAASNCPDSYGNNQANRTQITAGAANALLTQVYMWRKDYTDAIASSALVMGNSLYTFAPNMSAWSQIFTAGQSSSSIFEIGYDASRTNALRQLYALGGFAIFTPSKKFMNSFEDGDLRKDYIWDTTQSVPTLIWKFLGQGVSDEDPSLSDQDIVIARLAGIMLLRAEALTQLGGSVNITEALSLLNTIRKRAGLPVFENETAADAMYGSLEAAILHERSIELCFEGDRWFDLVRTGQAISTMQPLNGLSNEANLLWPIAQNTLNKNPNLVQNTYYK